MIEIYIRITITRIVYNTITNVQILRVKIKKNSCLLVGTWRDATWAIQFYEKFNFILHAKKQATQLLKKYWKIPLKQIKNSVVLERN